MLRNVNRGEVDAWPMPWHEVIGLSVGGDNAELTFSSAVSTRGTKNDSSRWMFVSEHVRVGLLPKS
jgi:hypothetical protein